MAKNAEISNQLAFVYALKGISREEIPVERVRVRFHFSPRKFVDYVRRLTSEDSRTEQLIKRSRRLVNTISRRISFHGVNPMANEVQQGVNHMLEKFRWKLETIVANRHTHRAPHLLLNICMKQCINTWNECIGSLDGQWLFHYGQIFVADLTIRDHSHLAAIVKEARDNGLMKTEKERSAAKGFLHLVKVFERQKRSNAVEGAPTVK